MDPVRALARPLLASVFVVDGLDALRHPEKHAALLEPYGPALDKAAETVPGVPAKRTVLVRISGGASVAAGLLLAIGKAPRLAAATLAVIGLGSTVVRHPFWSRKGEERREELSAPRIVVGSAARAARGRARLVSDLEPGMVTVASTGPVAVGAGQAGSTGRFDTTPA